MEHTPAQFLGPNGQAPALVVVQTQPIVSELLAQHAVFFLQVIDHVALVLVQAAGKWDQKESKRVQWDTHRDSVTSRSGVGHGHIWAKQISKTLVFWVASNIWTLRGHPTTFKFVVAIVGPISFLANDQKSRRRNRNYYFESWRADW
jgi:hypothetical protein